MNVRIKVQVLRARPMLSYHTAACQYLQLQLPLLSSAVSPACVTPCRTAVLQHWGCFNPLRDIPAAAFWQGQADTARQTYVNGTFDAAHIPKDRLLFFSGEPLASPCVDATWRGCHRSGQYVVLPSMHACCCDCNHSCMTVSRASSPLPLGCMPQAAYV